MSAIDPANQKVCFFKSKAFFFYFIVSIGYIAFALHLPLGIESFQTYDDALFMNLASYIVKGQWLGPFNSLTLAKGPGFPLYIAFNFFLGTPITLLTAILMSASSFVFTRSLKTLGMSNVLRGALFVIILFAPHFFSLRVLRESIYTPLTSLVVAGVVYVAMHKPGERYWRFIFFGLAVGWFWITREEGLWVLPGSLFIIFCKCVFLWLRKQKCLHIVYAALIMACAGALPVVAVSTTNFFAYGKFQSTNFTEPVFSQTLRLIQSVKVGPDIPLLPASAEKREELYRTCPSFQRLESYFKGKGLCWLGNNTIHRGKDFGGVYLNWALRAAIEDIGEFSSPQKFFMFCSRLNSEIVEARDAGKLVSIDNSYPFIGFLTDGQARSIPKKLKRAGQKIMNDMEVAGYKKSFGSILSLNRYRHLLGNPRSTMSYEEEMSLKEDGAVDIFVDKDGIYKDGKIAIAIKKALANLYRYVYSPVLALGVVCYFISLVIGLVKRKANFDLLVVSTGFYIMCITRLVMLVLIDITLFPAIHQQYIAPMYQIFYATPFLSFMLLKSCFIKRERNPWHTV